MQGLPAQKRARHMLNVAEFCLRKDLQDRLMWTESLKTLEEERPAKGWCGHVRKIGLRLCEEHRMTVWC